ADAGPRRPVTAVKYLVLCLALLAWLSAIGYPIRRLLDQPRGPVAPVPAPFLGLAVVQVVGWYWLEARFHGLPTPAGVVPAAAVVALIVTVARDGRRGRRADRSRLVIAGASLAGAAIVLGLNFSTVLGLGYVTTADSGNSDAAN